MLNSEQKYKYKISGLQERYYRSIYKINRNPIYSQRYRTVHGELVAHTLAEMKPV